MRRICQATCCIVQKLCPVRVCPLSSIAASRSDQGKIVDRPLQGVQAEGSVSSISYVEHHIRRDMHQYVNHDNICMSLYIRVCMYMCIYIYTHVCMYVCMYVCICIYIYIYIYISRFSFYKGFRFIRDFPYKGFPL